MIELDCEVDWTYVVAVGSYQDVQPSSIAADPIPNVSHLIQNGRAYSSFYGRDSSVGIATDFELDGQGSIAGRDKRLFSVPQRPNQILGPPSLLSNGYRGFFLRE
jgi:hypothetical protein